MGFRCFCRKSPLKAFLNPPKSLGLFYLGLRFGFVFFAYGGKPVWSFLLTVSPVRKFDLVFYT